MHSTGRNQRGIAIPRPYRGRGKEAKSNPSRNEQVCGSLQAFEQPSIYFPQLFHESCPKILKSQSLCVDRQLVDVRLQGQSLTKRHFAAGTKFLLVIILKFWRQSDQTPSPGLDINKSCNCGFIILCIVVLSCTMCDGICENPSPICHSRVH